MRFRVQDSGTSNGSHNKACTHNTNHYYSPSRERAFSGHVSFLTSVGEVVVSGVHVTPFTSFVHAEDASIKVSGSSIQFHAVLDILFDGVVVVSILIHEFLVSQTVGLVDHRHASLSFIVIKHWVFRAIIGEIAGGIDDLSDVGTISFISSLSLIVGGVGVTAGPLEVHIITHHSVKALRHKVIFDSGINLHDVSSLPSDIEIEDSSRVRNIGRSRANVEDVRSILEGSAILIGVERHGEGVSKVLYSFILMHRGGGSIELGINKGAIGKAPSIIVPSGDVVSETECAVFIDIIRNGPVEGRGVSLMVLGNRVSKMIISSPLSDLAHRGLDFPRAAGDPSAPIVDAG